MSISHVFTTLLFLFLGGIAFLLIVYSIKVGISPMPSSTKAKQAMLNLLKEYSFEGPIYELGAGWGTLSIPLAKSFPKSKVIAIEYSPIPYFFCWLRQAFSKKPKPTILMKDFFLHNLSPASVVVCYLYSGAMIALRDKFEKELKPGTLVLSNTFGIPGWIPHKTLRINDLYNTPIYLYKR